MCMCGKKLQKPKWKNLDYLLKCNTYFIKDTSFYKINQIVHALWLAMKPFYMSICKHGFRSSFISYFIKEM